MVPAVFLDKDGTLIDDVPYNVNPGLITLKAGAGTGLQKLKQAGYKLIVISNQSGVARGFFQEAALQKVAVRLDELLADFDVQLDGFYYCPHHPEGTVAVYAVACDCRKPMPGLLLRAARQHGIDLASSWMIGDILNDVEAGNRAGCHTILIDNGGETEWLRNNTYRDSGATVADLNEAADYIIKQNVSIARSDNMLMPQKQ